MELRGQIHVPAALLSVAIAPLNSNSMNHSLLEKLTVPQLVKKFPTFYGTRRFNATLTSDRHLSLSSAIFPCTNWTGSSVSRRIGLELTKD